MKTQIRSPLLNKQNNGISGITKKTKGHKERLGLGTLTLNRGISSQGSGATKICVINGKFFFKKDPEDQEMTLSLILRFTLRLGGYSIWSASTSRTISEGEIRGYNNS